jgi:L-threonylcarbamoyladenylate synthase
LIHTRIAVIDGDNLDEDVIDYGARLIRAGELVAFPTETVYGLGANALDGRAVYKIFEAKGRPADNPLIVHISNKEQLTELTTGVGDIGLKLMDAFWPGPLTIVVRKSRLVPDVVTAGLDTVAVRMPRHPVALSLIRSAGVPIAAPSANISGSPSPTTANHVARDLSGRIHLILDGGPCKVGVESTVLDITGTLPVLLRPGGITVEMLEQVVGQVEVDPGVVRPVQDQPVKSPGMKYRHYSPKARMVIVEGGLRDIVKKITSLADAYRSQGMRVGILATQQTYSQYKSYDNVIILGDREHPDTIAESLFSALRQLDEERVDIILAEGITREGVGLAIMNRMDRAAAFSIIRV